MSNSKGVIAGELSGLRAAKGTLFGFIGIGLACLGCCLAPILGTVALGGLASSMFALINTHLFLAALIGVSTGLAILWVWTGRSKECCANPDTECASGNCAVPAGATHEGRAKP